MHISFDFDYTLADSSQGTVVCATYALQQMGLPVPLDEKIKQTIGLSLERTFAALTGKAAEGDPAQRFKALFLAEADAKILGHIHLYPATAPLLEALQRQGHYVSIVSTKLKKRIVAALARDGLSHGVDLVVGGDCVAHNKPHPEPLLHAINLSGITNAQTLYVGDSISDAECAQLADVDFVGVLSGKTDAKALNAWQPKRLLGSVGELLASGLVQ